jgi:hypothetical protein
MQRNRLAEAYRLSRLLKLICQSPQLVQPQPAVAILSSTPSSQQPSTLAPSAVVCTPPAVLNTVNNNCTQPVTPQQPIQNNVQCQDGSVVDLNTGASCPFVNPPSQPSSSSSGSSSSGHSSSGKSTSTKTATTTTATETNCVNSTLQDSFNAMSTGNLLSNIHKSNSTMSVYLEQTLVKTAVNNVLDCIKKKATTA